MIPAPYDPLTYVDSIDIDLSTECACNECTHKMKIRDSVVFWSWCGDQRACYTFCSIEHLFHCLYAANNYHH